MEEPKTPPKNAKPKGCGCGGNSNAKIVTSNSKVKIANSNQKIENKKTQYFI